MKLKAILVLALTLFLSNDFSAQTINTSLNTTVRNITNLNIGFNRRSDKGNWWTDTSFKNLVSEMNPDVVRYPAGTQANFWDWREGRFLENTEKNWNGKEIVTIPTFINALPERTKAIYVVNMARPTPITGVDINASEAVLKSQPTLDAKIIDMLAAIAEFDTYGKLPYAVELGNEFYFGNEESGIYHIEENGGKYYSGWDEANNKPFESDSKADATEIIAAFYLKHCKAITAAIKQNYPSIKIILTTTKEGYATRVAWNSTIFNSLENNSTYSELKSDIHAVTQHHYLSTNYGVQTQISDLTSSKVAIAEGIEYPISKQSDYNLVPNNYKIWITEYGETKGIAEETWASAVRYAAFTYGWIKLGAKIEQLDWHHISDNNVVNDNNSTMILAPVGIAVKLLQQAIVNMSEMQVIDFSQNPISINQVKSLYGFKLINNEKESLFIINTSDSDFPNVNFNNLLTYSGQPKITQFYSDTPYIFNVYDGHSNIKSIVGDVNNSTEIKNFSVTVIESENTSLSVDNYLLDNIQLYPNPASNEILIKSNLSIKIISFYDVSGKKIAEFQNPKDSKLNIENLNSGLYFIKIDTGKNSVFRKLIKK